MKQFLCLFSLILALGCSAQQQLSDSEQVSSPLLDSLDARVLRGDFEALTSVLIAVDGELIYEKYYQGTDMNSKHNVRSGTKTMATLLIGRAMAQGHITSEQESIWKYLSHKLPVDNPDPRKDSIRIQDLLTMSSCLECDDNNQASRGHEERMYIIEDWTGFYLDLPIRSYPFSPRPEDCPYGRSMSYCSAGAATLSEVVQSAVGESSVTYLEDEILRPLGVTDYEIHETPLGLLNTAGGSEYRSRDLMKFIQLILQDGEWEGEQLIPAEFLQAACSPKANAWPGMDYGYLLWLTEFGEAQKSKAVAMAGNGGNKIVALPEYNATVVLTATNYGNRKAHGYTDEILNGYVVRVLEEMGR